MSKDTNNKDYIINIRVSRKTYDKIKDKAAKNSESVSSLMRNIIDDSVEIVSDLSRDIFGRGKGGKFKDVVSYYKASLAQDRACDNCGAEMKKHDTVIVGETSRQKRYYFCEKCR